MPLSSDIKLMGNSTIVLKHCYDDMYSSVYINNSVVIRGGQTLFYAIKPHNLQHRLVTGHCVWLPFIW